MSADLLYFEDLGAGDSFTTGWHHLDQDQLVAFAQAFDPQPFHLDDQAARATMFGGLAASGWHTAALTMRLLVDSGPRIAGGIVGASMKIEWKSPTRPGDQLQVRAEVLSCTPSASRAGWGVVVMDCTTFNQKQSARQKLTATLMVPCRPA